jgi:hypothetical protein
LWHEQGAHHAQRNELSEHAERLHYDRIPERGFNLGPRGERKLEDLDKDGLTKSNFETHLIISWNEFGIYRVL